MRQVAGRQLWISHAVDLRNARAVCDAGIAAVIELADSEPSRRAPARFDPLPLSTVRRCEQSAVVDPAGCAGRRDNVGGRRSGAGLLLGGDEPVGLHCERWVGLGGEGDF